MDHAYFTSEFMRILADGVGAAVKRHAAAVEPEHLLLACLGYGGPYLDTLLDAQGAHRVAMGARLAQLLPAEDPHARPEPLDQSVAALHITMTAAAVESERAGVLPMGTVSVFLALLREYPVLLQEIAGRPLDCDAMAADYARLFPAAADPSARQPRTRPWWKRLIRIE